VILLFFLPLYSLSFLPPLPLIAAERSRAALRGAPRGYLLPPLFFFFFPRGTACVERGIRAERLSPLLLPLFFFFFPLTPPLRCRINPAGWWRATRLADLSSSFFPLSLSFFPFGRRRRRHRTGRGKAKRDESFLAGPPGPSFLPPMRTAVYVT